ncbi:MAG: ABC transporter permease [Gaiellales bacterium]
MDRPGDGAERAGGASAIRLRSASFAVVVFLLAALATAFFALPLIGIFKQGDLRSGIDTSLARDAIRVSLITSGLSLATMLIVGTPVAYWLANTRVRGASVLQTLFELPLVLPPAVAGIGLFAAFGRAGLLGSQLDALGIQLPFTQAAVVMAMTFVAGPLYLRQAQAAFAAVDPDMLAAARTLGAGRWKVFFEVAIPLASAGLGAGAALGWARALGEFGATIMFAGSLQGVTQTAPIAIYLGFEQGNFDAALALGAVLVCVSAAVLFAVRLVTRGGRLLRFEPS